jgi:hypothetical protein
MFGGTDLMAFCPRCAHERMSNVRYCTSCKFDFDDPAASTAVPPAPSVSAPALALPAEFAPKASNNRLFRWVAALVIVAVLGGGYYFLKGGSANIPPPGTIWFGESFDPESYAVRGRLSSVGADDEFVMVGRLTESVAGSRLVIRAYLDGELLTIAWTLSTDEGGIWGFNLGPVHFPGTWRYEIADIGGDALASGQILARD